MRTAITTALLIAAIPALAQMVPPIKYEIESDMQQTQELVDQSFQQGSSVEMHFSIRSSGRWLNLTGLSGNWYGQEDATSTQRIEHASTATITNTTPHYFRVRLNSGATGTARDGWQYSLVVVEDATEASFVMGVGALDIVASSYAGPAAVIVTPTVEAYLEARLDGIEGEITTNVIANLTWETISGKPFEVLSDLTTNNLTGVAWTDFVVGAPWESEGYIETGSAATLASLTTTGDVAIGGNLSGAGRSVFGLGLDIADIGSDAYGSTQRGVKQGGTVTIGFVSAGSSQIGLFETATATIGNDVYGATQRGSVSGAMTIGDNAHGATQIGRVSPTATATNNAMGAMQLLDLTAGQSALTTFDGRASLMLGAGTITNKNSIVAGDGGESQGDGSIVATGTMQATAFNYPQNRSPIPAYTDVGTNAVLTISHTDGARQSFDFGSSTNALHIEFAPIDFGFDAEVDARFVAFTNRAVTFTTNSFRFVEGDAPDTDYVRLMIEWDTVISGGVTNSRVQAINTTWSE